MLPKLLFLGYIMKINMKKNIFFLALLVVVIGVGFFVWGDLVRETWRLWALRAEAPDFRSPLVVVDPLFAPPTAQQLKDQAVAAAKQLAMDWKSFDGWMQLAAIRKVAGDLQGAARSWEFASKIRPIAAVPLHNLANLYGYDLADPARAEVYYLRALALDKNDIPLYRSVYEFYRFIKKDEATARRYLQEGIANNLLSAEDLHSLLRSF